MVVKEASFGRYREMAELIAALKLGQQLAVEFLNYEQGAVSTLKTGATWG